MGNLDGKVAIVTGASKGIGAGIAKGLGAAGGAVVVNYAASREGADRVVADITGRGGRAIAVQADMANADDVRRLFEETRKAFGSLDVLVNNAGVYQFDPIESVSEREFHREIDTNVLGPILAIREAVKHFGPRGGSVINVSSIVSTAAVPNSVVYSASKGALDAVTRVLAAELGPREEGGGADAARTLGPAGGRGGRGGLPGLGRGRLGDGRAHRGVGRPSVDRRPSPLTGTGRSAPAARPSGCPWWTGAPRTAA